MKKKVISRIETHGPLRFDEFMEMCLYDPEDGFFSAGRVRAGDKADFLTSPEVSSWFGSLVGAWAADIRSSDHPSLIEVGGGSGSMLKELAPFWLDDHDPVYAVERSSAARDEIARGAPEIMVLSSLDDIPRGIDVVVVANEVLDNMPASLARKTGTGWVEIGVDVSHGDLCLVDIDARPSVVTWCEDLFPTAEPETTVTVQMEVARWIEAVLERFGNVAMCVIDYSDRADELSKRDEASLVRTYREHRVGVDWLARPGDSDITVDVNIDGVVAAASRSGASVVVTTQREFLIAQGAEELIEDARDMEHLHAAEGRIMEQLTVRSERIGIEALLDRGGLGGFIVFQITKGT